MACASALMAAGCGASAPTQTHDVSVTITAPTSGATLGVHRVLVTGVVSPANAQVLVGGEPAQVSGGRFTRSVWLTSPTQTVRVTAQAPGYVSGLANTTVSYSSTLAAQITTSTTELASSPASTGPASQISSGAAASALSAALSLPASASSKGGSHGSTGGSSSGTGSTSSSSSTPSTTPTPTAPVVTPAQIKAAWTAGCLKHASGVNVSPYCTCMYDHLYATGVFNTVSSVNALVRRLNAYARSGDVKLLSKPIQGALVACASKLPALTPLGGRPTLTKLPGASHNPYPAPTPTTPTTPAAPTSTTGTTTTGTTPTTTTGITTAPLSTSSTLSPVPPSTLYGR